jgi:quinol monooxygenase YgiN
MIIVHAFIEVKNGKVDEFLKAAGKCVEATRKEKGCHFYTLYTNSSSPQKFVIVEEWESKPALDAQMQTPHFAELGADIKDLLAAPLDIKVFEASKL